ncbi:MAG: endonuclease/exonuclease/phosphatase family protein [Fidelibacterota bacterium]
MKKGLLFIVVTLSIIPLSCGPERPLTVGFWNVENLFDLEDDPIKDDDEFTPMGRKHVTGDILATKLENLSEVLTKMDADVLGLAEVENRRVAEMLDERCTRRDYTVIEYESPDFRGIDVAFLYDAARFRVLSSEPVPVDLGEARPTRDILHVRGEFAGETLHIFVNHWPSHWDGTEQTNPFRAKAARTLRSQIDAILKDDPAAEIVVLGDLNDQPTAPSVATHLGCTLSRDSVSVGRPTLWNLMAPFLDRVNQGTYKYRGNDLVYDQIIVSPGLTDSKGLTVLPRSLEIFDGPKYRQQEGMFRGYPFRFWAGDSLLGGYSDHLPVMVSIGVN